MPMIKTSPISNDGAFFAVRDAINRVLARYGFPLVQYKGSTSWLAGAADPSRSTETCFKLLYRGRKKSYIFGIRKDFAFGFEKLKDLPWPMGEDFAVMPATTVAFCGFEIDPGGGELAAQRVEKILRALPEPDPDVAISPSRASYDDFDAQLNAL